MDGIRPTVASVAITSDPGDDDTYGAGDVISVTVTFSEDVHIKSSVELGLDIGGVSKKATYTHFSGINIPGRDGESSGAAINLGGVSEVVLTYTVAVGDADNDGISVIGNSFRQKNDRIKDLVGNRANLSHSGISNDDGHLVNAPGGL
ncbi:MAG: hypothetical protein F4W95_00455 [Chloroflexi bacterium]|nr:hypothetical protein [Chloroflexota bacterium]MYD46938.1 hypothetical protein [Chloroflexota bacterium]